MPLKAHKLLRRPEQHGIEKHFHLLVLRIIIAHRKLNALILYLSPREYKGNKHKTNDFDANSHKKPPDPNVSVEIERLPLSQKVNYAISCLLQPSLQHPDPSY
jgi:hypothetical protein